MKYQEMNNTEKFLASFNNKPNGYAKVINVCGNVILGYLGNFGYSVFEMQSNGYFATVKDFGFGKQSEAEKEFKERKDQTGMLPLDTKVRMVKNEEAKSFLIERINAITMEQRGLEKWKVIQAGCLLDNLKTKTVKQLEDIALFDLNRISSYGVFMGKFLNVI